MSFADLQPSHHGPFGRSSSPASPAKNRGNIRGREDIPITNPFNTAKRISTIDTMTLENSNSTVVQISGASRNVGRAGDLAAYGVIYGSDPNQNCCDIVPANLPQTTQVAYLYATKQVLTDALDEMELQSQAGSSEPHVLILTDSDYLVNGICVDMGRWKQSGYRNERGLFIQNRKLFRQLESLIARLLAKGVRVSFWQIRWEENKMAEGLACEVLDMAEHVLAKRLW